MRVDCKHCQGKTIISHRRKISESYTQLYANCQEPSCGARTVVDLSFNRTISPPENEHHALLTGLINSMNAEDKAKLISAIT